MIRVLYFESRNNSYVLSTKIIRCLPLRVDLLTRIIVSILFISVKPSNFSNLSHCHEFRIESLNCGYWQYCPPAINMFGVDVKRDIYELEIS